MASFLRSVPSLFADADTLPWTDAQAIQACERDLDDAAQAAYFEENLRNLAWALVHSQHEADVARGLSILHHNLATEMRPERRRQMLYLMSVGYFRTQELGRSRWAVTQALQESPDFQQAARLKKMVEKKITADGMVGAGLVAASVLSAGVAIVMGAAASTALLQATLRK